MNSLYGGGAEKVLQTVLQNFDLDRYDVTLIDHRQEVADGSYPAGIKYRSILKSRSRGGGFWVKAYNKINLLVYENLPPRIFRLVYLRAVFDVEIAFIEGYASRIVSAGRSARKIAWVHTDMKGNPWSTIAYRSPQEQQECYRRFDRVVCVSQSVKASFDELFPGTPSEVVYNPVDGAEIRRKACAFTPPGGGRAPGDGRTPGDGRLLKDGISPEEERSPVDERTLLFVSVGRLVPQKGYDRLIPIVGRLAREGFDLRLWIVGEGSERELLEKLIEEWDLADMVTLWGWQTNPHPFVAAADWFVCSSRSEGYSTVVTEALISGTPVVSVECAGTAELLGDDRWGIVVENDDEALLDKLRDILKNVVQADRYRKAAAERGGHFSLERQMSSIYRVIEG